MYKEGLERYPLMIVIFQNLFLMFYFSLGIIGMWDLRLYGFSILSIIYSLFLIVMLLFILRKHLCTHCYYYGKICSTGWGKLSAMMFEKDSGNYALGVRLAKITWALATITPIMGMILVLIINFKLYILMILILFILLSFVNLIIHKYSCSRCKMR